MEQDTTWEERCRRCGRCCYEKYEYEGQVTYTHIPCEYLDLQTNTCMVYPDRVSARPGCVALTAETIRMGILPADCPYVEGIPDYKAPILREEEGE